MLSSRFLISSCIAMLAATAIVVEAKAQPLRVTVENLSEEGGLFLTPLWFGFHDGSFDVYDPGGAIRPGLEQLVEDGPVGAFSAEFLAETSATGGQDGVVLGTSGFGSMPMQPPVIDAGETASAMIAVNPSNRYFSYASMVIPSNDAFIANGNPLAREVFDAAGNFMAQDFIILGSQVLDAGTEENTEMDAAFINQANDNDGNVTTDGVSIHPGFIGSEGGPAGTSIILGGTNAAGENVDAILADFTRSGFQVARIRVEQIPEPTSLALVGFALVGLGVTGRRKR